MDMSGREKERNDKISTKRELRKRKVGNESRVSCVLLLGGGGSTGELVVRFNHLSLDVRENGRVSEVFHGEFSFSLGHSSDLRGV